MPVEKKVKSNESDKKKQEEIQGGSFRIFSHDLNNIFNNVRSSTELCRLFLNNPNQLSKVYEQLAIISGQVTRGIKLVSNARKISQFNENSLQVKKVDVVAILNKASDFIKKNFQDKKLNIEIDSFNKSVIISANETLLDVFENILVNAVLHNLNYDIDIIIKIKKIAKDNIDYVKIGFSDNGIGISDDRKKWIFQESFKKNKSGKGMGFGLTLTKKIIDIYHGFIWVEDRVKDDYSKGSIFVVLLPINPDI
ncbi:MAG: sensor histidine kinase [Promethearchaeota archaeon]